ncbi:MAG: fimbrillin family protein [Tannerellaceae bacterium]|nr:fimbrillin family protein [Tannerellaceae bacterium]
MKKLIGLLFFSGLICACSGSDDNDTDEPVVIRVTSTIVSQSEEGLQNTQIETAQRLSFFVTQATTPEVVRYDNVPIQGDGAGNFSFTNSINYPSQDETWDFIAVNPYEPAASMSDITEYTVKTDQTVLSGYQDSDLLYGKTENVSRTGDPVNIEFKHKLSRLHFVLKQGASLPLSQLTSLQLQNIYMSVNMDLRNGEITTIADEFGTIEAYGAKGSSLSTLDGIQAVIVPQVFIADYEGGKTFFQVTIGDQVFDYTPAQNITFMEGQCYTYIITVMDEVIHVTSSPIP